MTDIQDLKQAARMTRNEAGEPVVEIPLPTWHAYLAAVEPQPSQKQQIEALFDQWDHESEEAMSAEWWDEFETFLNENRVDFGRRSVGLADE